MEIKSIGLKSEIFFYEDSSNISIHKNYLKIETPDNPNYFWGNLIIFDGPPKADDFEKWMNIFKDEFSNNPAIKHITFAWDIFGGKEDLTQFINYGFNIEETIVLVTESVQLEFKNTQFTYREIISSADWNQVINLQVQVGVETLNYSEEKYRLFVKKRFETYQRLIAKGKGKWFGAFDGEKLMADLGLFGTEEFKRFQSIETDPQYRKMGAAQNLIAHAISNMPAKNYIMHATPNGPAIDMYMRLGFKIKEVMLGVCCFNRKEWVSEK